MGLRNSPDVPAFLDRDTEIPYIMNVSGDADDELRFVWDPGKAEKNLRQHKITFETATFVFDDPLLLEEDDVFAEGEYRTIAIGKVEGFVLTVVYSTPEEQLYRLISARLATAEERQTYERQIFLP